MKTRHGFEWLLALLALWAAAPLWMVQIPPIQDLPQHLAAIRIFGELDEPALRFSEFFEIELGRTQYLAYYLAAWLLSIPFGVELANRILLTAAIVGTPYAMRALLKALGRDERLCLFVLPLTWNAHLILGFLNFVAAIPLAIWGLALAVQLRVAWSRGRAILLGIVAILTFYTHIVPFGLFGLSAALVGVGDGWIPTLKRWLPLGPAALAALLWARISPAGQSTLTAALLGETSAGPQPIFMTWPEAMRQAPSWLTDVLQTETDDRLLIGWGLLLLLAMALRSRPPRAESLRDALLWRVGILCPLAALLYFVTPASYDWIWPINARFPLLALLFLVPLLPWTKGPRALALFASLSLLSAASFHQVGEAFQRFEAEEVGDLEGAIEVIPEGSKVVGLIFDRGSEQVRFSPFIHSAAWVQTRRGGAAMFTFADFPQSPVRFREANRPPRVGPRWEWMPERVNPDRDLGWYEYALVRGGPGLIARSRSFEPIHRSARWSVWRRVPED